MPGKILIATSNKGKIREIKAILLSIDLEILTPDSLDCSVDVKETGETYAENARLKAEAYLHISGLPVLADDSGLEVDALNGAPGLRSARFSPKLNANDLDRRLYLLEKLQGQPQPWKAQFHCTAVLLLPSGEKIQTNGDCPGIIIPQMRGSGGFGYDPIFYLPKYEMTMAELPSAVKNTISHRAKALDAMMPSLQKFLTS
jgi:XTP/dITP diphosphohydrolase